MFEKVYTNFLCSRLGPGTGSESGPSQFEKSDPFACLVPRYATREPQIRIRVVAKSAGSKIPILCQWICYSTDR
jgi:hypothetical protein